ncbi:peptidase [Halopenitus sp. H-Gu1]|uniref:peptidase n=1 Tax=Halopenitus sp. H-Gu1 TaxID=3242697 RepID=UPI00359D489C
MLRIALLPVVAVVAMIAATVGPLYAADRFLETREPTRAERARLDALREAAGLDVEAVAVIDDGGRTPEIAVRGPPGRRVLFVSDEVVGANRTGGDNSRAREDGTVGPGSDGSDENGDGEAALDEGTIQALFAAEAARVETHYAEFRAAAVAAILSILAAIVVRIVPFGDGFTALVAIGIVSLWAGRRIQYAADARAADRVGADRLADAFERAAARRGVEPERGTWRTFLEVQPPLGDRIDRLRERE